MIAFLMIAGLGVLALLSRFAALTRMTIPLLYTVSMLTVFHGWYRAHTVLADRILFALVGLVVLSWLLSLIRFVCDLVMQARDGHSFFPDKILQCFRTGLLRFNLVRDAHAA